jgi:hypothetical protein
MEIVPTEEIFLDLEEALAYKKAMQIALQLSDESRIDETSILASKAYAAMLRLAETFSDRARKAIGIDDIEEDEEEEEEDW